MRLILDITNFDNWSGWDGMDFSWFIHALTLMLFYLSLHAQQIVAANK